MKKKEKTVEEILAEYPQEIVKFFESEMKLEGWEITKRLRGYLPSPAQQFINKLKNVENQETYEVIFTFNKK